MKDKSSQSFCSQISAILVFDASALVVVVPIANVILSE